MGKHNHKTARIFKSQSHCVEMSFRSFIAITHMSTLSVCEDMPHSCDAPLLKILASRDTLDCALSWMVLLFS